MSHSMEVDTVKVLTIDMANRVVAKIASADALFMAMRDANDPMCPSKTAGAVSFSARYRRETDALFAIQFPTPAAIVAKAVSASEIPIYCIDGARPVSMAALTTILGMIPLVFDAFFGSMAITIMAGLGFATVLTLIVVPVMFAILFKIKPTTA